jgi:hypothetical protein
MSRIVQYIQFIVGCLCITSATFAQTWTWTGANSTNWSEAANWNPVSVPNSATADVIIPNGLIRYPELTQNIEVRSITFNNAGTGNPATLTFNGFNLTVCREVDVQAWSGSTQPRRIGTNSAHTGKFIIQPLPSDIGNSAVVSRFNTNGSGTSKIAVNAPCEFYIQRLGNINTAGNSRYQGVTFNNTVTMTISTDAWGNFISGNNIYNENTNLNFIGTNSIFVGYNASWFYGGQGDRDTFAKNLTISTSGHDVNLWANIGGNLSVTTSATGQLQFGSDISSSTITGTATFTTNGNTGGEGIRVAQNSGQVVIFNGNVTINNTNSIINNLFRCARLGSVTFNGNITVNSTGGASGQRGIRIADDETQNGTVTLAADRYINASGMQVGQLVLNRITQASGTNTQTHNLSVPSTVLLQMRNNTLHGNLTATGNRMLLRGNTLGSNASNTLSFTLTGATGDNCGGNTYNGVTTFTHNGTAAEWSCTGHSDGGADVFNANANFVNSNGQTMVIARNTLNNLFHGATTFTNNSGIMFLTESALSTFTATPNTSAIFNGTVTFTNNSNGGSPGGRPGAIQIVRNGAARVIFNNTVNFVNNSSNGDDGQIAVGTYGGVTFNGNINITRNGTSSAFATNRHFNQDGRIFVAGTADQTITSNQDVIFLYLELNKAVGTKLILGSNTNMARSTNTPIVSPQLVLNSGLIELGNFNLVLEHNTSWPTILTGGSANSYVIATGTGRLFRQVNNTNVLFPVGTASAYMPLTLNNAGTADMYGVRMADLGAAPYNINSYFVSHGWDVTENTAGGSDNTLTGQWNAANEQTDFNRTQSAFYRWSGTQFNCLQPEAAAGGTGPYTRSVSALGATNSIGVFALATAFADAFTGNPNVQNATSCGAFNLDANVNPFTGPGQWSQVSGPSTVTFANPSSPTSLVSGMITGTYVFRWTTAQGCTNRTSDVTVHFTQVSLTPVAHCTWTGNANNGNWNDCANWTGSVPGEVSPGVYSNITIPGGLTTMYPVLTANVVVNDFTMTNGASINLGNFTLEARGATAIAGSTITANGGLFHKTSTSNDTWAGGNTFSGSLTIRHSGSGGILNLAATAGNTFNSTVGTGNIANHTYIFDIAHANANIVFSAPGVNNTVTGNLEFHSLRNADFQAGGINIITTNIHSTVRATNLQSGRRLVMENYAINRGGTFTLTLYGLFTVNNTITLTNGRTLLADGTDLLLDNTSPSAVVGVTGMTHDGREIAPGDIHQQTGLAATGTFSWRCVPNATPYRFPVGFGGWNPGNTRWGRMSAFTFVLQSGTDIISVRSTGFISPGVTYHPVTNARTGFINNQFVNLQWIVTCADPSSNLQFTGITLPWRQFAPNDNFEQATFTTARNRSGITRFNHSLNRWECVMPMGTPTTFAPDQYSHTVTGVLTKTNATNLGVFGIVAVTADPSPTATVQNTPCRTILLDADDNMLSSSGDLVHPVGGQWVFISGPSTPTILNPTNPVTQVLGATIDGNYTFEWRRFSPTCGGTLAAPIHAAQVTVSATATGSPSAGATTTWTGSLSSNWNDCANWSDGIPDVITNVTIPSSAPHWPVLPGNVTVNRIVANTGAEIDLQNFTLTTRNRSNPSDPTTIDFDFRSIFQNTTIRSTTGVASFDNPTNGGAYITGPLLQFRSCTFTGDINLLMTNNHQLIVQCGGNTFNERARVSNMSRGEWRWGVALDGGRDVFEKDAWIEVADNLTGMRQNFLNTYWNGYNTSYPPVWTGGNFPDPVDYISPPYYVPGSGNPYTGIKVGFPAYPRNDVAPTNDPDPSVNAANFAANESAKAANFADELQSEANITQATQNAREAAIRASNAINTLTAEINLVNTLLANSPVPAAANPCSNAAAITAAQNALNTAIANATNFRNTTLQTAANNANAAANDTNLTTSTPGQDNAAANAANNAVNQAQTHRANMWTALTNYLAAVNTCINNYNNAQTTANTQLLATGHINMAFNTADNEFKQNTYVRATTNGRIHFAFDNGSSVRFGGATVNPSLITQLRASSAGGNWGAINVARRGTAIFNTPVIVRQSGGITDDNGAIRIYRENSTAGAVTFNHNLTISQPGEALVYLGETNNGTAGGVVLNGDLIIDSNLDDAVVDNIHRGGLFFNNFTKNSASDFSIITENTGRLQTEMGNIFNGNALFENRSNGSGQRIGYDNAASVQTFNGNVTLRNTAVSSIQVSGRGNVNFNGNIVVENTFDFLSINDPNRCGVCFGQHWDIATGVSSLADTKTITIGSGGYASGTLLLQRFMQLGTGTPQNITLTTPQSEISLFGSTFQSSVTLEAPELRVRNSVFQPTAADGTTFTHLIVNARGENTGGNMFHEPAIFELRGVRSPTLNPTWNIGENDKDEFLDEVTFINAGGASHLSVANRNAGHVFVRKATFINGINSPTSTDVGGERNRMRIANEEGATVTFQGEVVVENRQSTEGEIAFARQGDIVINGNLSLSNVNGSLLFGGSNRNNITDPADNGLTTLNGTLTLQSGWQKGMLMLRGFTCNNTAPITLELPSTLTGTDNTLVIGKNAGGRSLFKASAFTAKARVLLLNGATYEGADLLFEKTGAGSNESRGDNNFKGVARFVNHTGSDFVMAHIERDIFGNNVTFEEIGTGRINPAFRGTNEFKGDITVISSNNRDFEFSRDIGSTSATGIVQISGTGTQNLVNNISNTAREISFRSLAMNQLTASSLLVPNRNFTIRFSAIFKRGKIRLDDKILTILNHTNPASVAVVGADLDDSYVQTNGTGTVRRTVVAAGASSATVLFPVGNTTSYLALGLRQSGGAAVTDVYNVRVRDGVHMTYDASNNPTGATINRMFVNGAWIVSENVSGGTNAQAFLYWKPDDELAHFQRTQSAIVRYNRSTNKWRCTQAAGNINGSTPAPLFWRISGGTATEINDVGVFSVASVVALATTPITTCGSGSVTLNAIPFNDPSANASSPFEGKWSFVSASDGSNIVVPPSEENKWNATIPGLQSGVTYQFRWANTGLEGECNPGPSIVVTVIVDPSTPIPGVLVRWTGNAGDGDWFNCRNWDRLFIPNHTHDVEIRDVSVAIPSPGTPQTAPNGLPNYTTTGTNTYPVIANATAFCRSLTIFANASVTIQNGGEINVLQSVTNNQTFTVQAGGKAIIGLDLTNAHTFTNAGEVRIGRSFLHNHTAPLNHNTGDIIFNGATSGVIGGTQPIRLNRVFVQKIGGLASVLTLTRPLTINARLQLTSGKIVSSAANLLLLPLNSICNDGNPQSFVQGPVRREVGNNESFVFPTGRGNRWARISVTDLAGASPTDHFTAEYFTNNPYPNGMGAMCPPGPNSLAPQLDHVSYVEHWQLDRNTGGTVQAKVALYWENPARNASDIFLFSNLYAARYNGSCWENRGGNLFGTLAAGRVETPSRQNAFSPWTISTDLPMENQPLPVELVSLKAELTTDNHGLISWTTAWEENAAFYEVQRSANGKDFEPLGRVAATGNSNTRQHYQFIDVRPMSGINYYRLRQVDTDGSFTFSPMVDLIVETSTEQWLELFPNPIAGNNLQVRLFAQQAGNANLQIYDLSGRLLWQQPVEVRQGTNQWTIEAAKDFAKGVYLLKLSNRQQATRFVVN